MPASPAMFGCDPNITGFFNAYALEIGTQEDRAGVFLDSIQKSRKAQQSNGSGQGSVQIDFKASNGNSIYSGENIQIPALQCLACIKI